MGGVFCKDGLFNESWRATKSKNNSLSCLGVAYPLRTKNCKGNGINELIKVKFIEFQPLKTDERAAQVEAFAVQS